VPADPVFHSAMTSQQWQPVVRYRSLPTILLLLLVLLPLSLSLSGCSTPGKARVVSRETPVKKPVRSAKPAKGYYQVKRGDTLFSIAWRYGLDFPSLAAWNGIRSPYTIYPGQKLRLVKPSATSRSKKKYRKSTHKQPSASSSVRVRKSRQASSKSTSKRVKSGKKPVASAAKLRWKWPTSGRVVQRFKSDDPGRKGIKIGGRSGQKVVAAEGGKVVYAGSGLIGYGRLIIIKHNKNYLSAYGHNRKLLIQEGTRVSRGQLLAEMGQNGSGQSLLHFEIRRNGIPVDPLRLLPRRK